MLIKHKAKLTVLLALNLYTKYIILAVDWHHFFLLFRYQVQIEYIQPILLPIPVHIAYSRMYAYYRALLI